MLRTRFLVGTILVLAISGILIGDAYVLPQAPCLLAAILFLGWSGTREFWRMLPEADRPAPATIGCCVPLILIANWFPHLTGSVSGSIWTPMLTALIVSTLATMLFEVVTYSADGLATRRISTAVMVFLYLGVLPSFLIQLRWLPQHSGSALAAAIFVPKIGDIFALLTGMTFGKHKMTPLLSPKKTWEGFIGGMVAAIATAIIFYLNVPELFRSNVFNALSFGFTVGLAGVVGDLVESLFKRDCQTKDASASVPGFGGILDVVDSVVYSAPIAYFILVV